MTGGNTNHYATAGSNQEIDKRGGSLETRKTLNNLEIERTVEKAHAVAAAVTLTVAVAVRRAAGRHTPPRVAKARPS